jgi:hypothetical protein
MCISYSGLLIYLICRFNFIFWYFINDIWLDIIIQMDNKILKSNGGNGSNKGFSLMNFITQYDSLVVFGSLILLILATIIFTGLFVAGPIVRTDLLFNAGGAFLISFLFIYVIFTFMGQHIVIFGVRFDVGMVLYILIVMFIMFILGN